MIVSSTEVQNNFGKYLMLSAKEDVIITRNGVPLAKLSVLRMDQSPTSSTASMEREGARELDYCGQKATYEEFLQLPQRTEERYEYIQGEIYRLASPKTAHQAALVELTVLFHDWSEGKECRVFVAPYDITLKSPSGQINEVQPDIMIICDLDEHLGDDGYYKGVPTLLVEILSDATARRDLVKKLDLYMSCGVAEYWVVDPDERLVFAYSFRDGTLDEQRLYRLPGKAQSRVFPDLVVDLDRVFR